MSTFFSLLYLIITITPILLSSFLPLWYLLELSFKIKRIKSIGIAFLLSLISNLLLWYFNHTGFQNSYHKFYEAIAVLLWLSIYTHFFINKFKNAKTSIGRILFMVLILAPFISLILFHFINLFF